MSHFIQLGCRSLLGFWIMQGMVTAAEPVILFEDDYSVLDSAFGEPAKDISVNENALSKSLDAGYWWRSFYQSALFDGFDASIRLRLAAPDNQKGAKVGLAFWGKDLDSFYAVLLSDSGTCAIVRFADQKWTAPMPWRKSDAIKTDDGDWNDIRVVGVGHRATLFINGKKVGSIKGSPPEGGSLIGLYFESATDENSQGYYSALKVVEPDPNEFKAEPVDPNLFFADDFTEFDAGWGGPASDADVKEGMLVMKAEPGRINSRLYNAATLTGEVELTTSFTIVDGNDSSRAAGGIVFWSNGVDDYWTAVTSDDNMVSVLRWSKTRWLVPMPFKKLPKGAETAQGKPTQLSVIVRGRKATVVVNGTTVATINGQPPGDSWLGGLYCEASDGAASQVSFLDVRAGRVANKP